MKNPETLIQLLREYYVEIPMQQRDYAQGRKTERIAFIRNNLLFSIRSALLNAGEGVLPLDLNFVYGTCDSSGKFIPLDGQQRLTTLFLIHVFAYRDDEGMTELLHRFSYETRSSSKRFIRCLINNRAEIFIPEEKPSRIIEDAKWFQFGWIYDPTISSCLTMLDSIQDVFGFDNDWGSLLLSDVHPPVVFHFKDIEKLGMDESLYIKLNARGKALTTFETFKARLISRIKDLDFDFDVEFKMRFSSKLDSKWTDYFWNLSCEKFDLLYLNFFRMMLVTAEVINWNENNWDTAIDFNKISAQLILQIYRVLDYLCSNDSDPIANELIKDSIELTSPSFRSYLFVFAVTSYFLTEEPVCPEGFHQWLRVLKNLIGNSVIDHDYLYFSAIESINALLPAKNSILEYLDNGGGVKQFNREQVAEEREKAHILLMQNKDYSEAIYHAEENNYFSGRINGALALAHPNGTFDLPLFMNYWSKLRFVFGSRDLDEKQMNLVRRALLCFGDYTMTIKNYKTLCTTNPEDNTKTYSFKSLFSSPSNITTAFLDELDLEKDLDGQLEAIIHNSIVDERDWRYCFVNYPELLERSELFFFSKMYLRLKEVNPENDDEREMLLIPGLQTNGYNYEIFILVLLILLRKEGIACYLDGEYGSTGKRYLVVEHFFDSIVFRRGRFVLKAKDQIRITESNTPIEEALRIIKEKCLEQEDH